MTYYGVDITLATSDPTTACVRLGSSSNFTSLAAGAAGAAYCSTVAPWMYITRCNLADDGTVTNVYGDSCYSDTDVANMGQAMVFYPAFMYYVNTATSGHVKYYISDNLAGTDQIGGVTPAWALHPAFISNNINHSGIFVGAYESYYNSSTTLNESKANVQPTNNVTIDTARTASQRATGWGLQTVQIIAMQQLLFLIEYASRDSQTQIGPGIVTVATTEGGSWQQDTGYTSSSAQTSAVDLGNTSGAVPFTSKYYTGTQTTQYAISYRGVENAWGNMWKWCDGINLNTDHKVWVADHSFASNKFLSPYSYSGLLLPTSIYAYELITVDATQTGYQWLFLPALTQTMDGTHNTTYYCDWIELTSQSGAWRQGGGWHDQNYAGLFMQGAYPYITYNTYHGSRMMYLPMN